MLFILKAVLLWGSIFGYCAFYKKYMNPAFTPIFTLSSIGVLIFVAGLLNIMAVSAILIVLGGWICLFLCKHWNKNFFADNKTLFVVFAVFSAICGIFLLRVYKQISPLYDSYSHWLTVVREMLKSDSMPNFNSSLIIFQGYPTGSAGFIYFICKILGNSRDDLILFAQAILYAASITSFGAFVKRRDVFGVLIALVGSLFCITGQTFSTMENLLVDTLIPLISIGVVAIVIYYRNNLMTGVLVSLPLQLFLVTIKNSGIMMVAINFTLVLALVISADYTSKGKLSFLNLVKFAGITAGLPAVLYFLWIRHVDYVFIDGSYTKHTASVENYMKMLSAKTVPQIKEILHIFYKRFISWNSSWALLIIVSGIVIIGWLIKKYLLKRNSKAEFFILPAVLGAYLAFMAVLAVMYIVSMPYDEAIFLASYDRYEKTILIYIVGAITIYALSLISLFPGYKKGILIKGFVLLLVSSILLLQTTNIKYFIVKKDNYTGSSRVALEQIKSDYAVAEGKDCFIYGSLLENDPGYHYYLSRYVFWTPNVCICTPENFDELKSSIEEYDYLIITNYDDQINSYLSSCGIDINKQVYAVEEVFQ